MAFEIEVAPPVEVAPSVAPSEEVAAPNSEMASPVILIVVEAVTCIEFVPDEGLSVYQISALTELPGSFDTALVSAAPLYVTPVIRLVAPAL